MEKVRKDREQKEPQATKNQSIPTHSDGDKGKGLMEDLRELTIVQQLKTLIHTSIQRRQKMEMMTSVLDTQETTAAQNVTHILLIVAVTQPTDNQDIDDKNPFKRLKMQVSFSPTPTINLDDSDLQEEVIASTPLTIEVDQNLKSFTYLLNGDSKKYFIHVPTVSKFTSFSSSSSSTLLLSSIQILSTLPARESLSTAFS